MTLERIVETDVLVIGGGMAGTFAAIKAKEQGLDVTLVDKGYVSRSGATAFCGGYFMVFNSEWGNSLDTQVNHISVSGEYVNDREWTELVLRDAYARYQDLASWGVEFVVDESGIIRMSESTANVNMYRRKYTPIMRQQTLNVGVKIIDRVFITDLLKQEVKVIGAVGFHARTGDLYIFKSKATIIAAGQGGFKQAGLPTHYRTGDGEGIGYRAGAEITGKEYGGKGFGGVAAYPAWRGHGMTCGKLWKYVNGEGKPIDLSGTSGICSMIWLEYEAHAGHAPIFWNLDEATDKDVKSMLAHQLITGTTLETDRIGLDVTQGGKVPILFGAQTGSSIYGGGGGLWPVNKNCATTLVGLYAAGDICATRQGGSNYPGTGFGLAHAAVTGARAGLGAAEYASKTGKITVSEDELVKLKKAVYAPIEHKGGFSPEWVKQQIQSIMVPYYIWQIKHGERMQAALTFIEFIRNHLVPKIAAKDAHELRMAHETKNMALNAEMMLRAAIFRTESRGTHYREDYPRRDDPAWLAWVKVKEEQGRMKLWKVPIQEDWWPDLSKPYGERYLFRFPGG